MFEDDGHTGYFYAYGQSAPEDARILDARRICNVATVLDRVPSEVEIVWTTDGFKATLFINDYREAYFGTVDRNASPN